MIIASYINDSITDGPGFRQVIFFQGCPHHCKGCHNPESWSYEGGTEVTISQLLKDFTSNPMLRGITFSGGEPFSERNLDEMLQYAKIIKSRGKTVWSFTGYTLENLVNVPFKNKVLEVLQYVDVLVDGPFILSQLSYDLKYKGSRNQRLIDIKHWRETGNIRTVY